MFVLIIVIIIIVIIIKFFLSLFNYRLNLKKLLVWLSAAMPVWMFPIHRVSLHIRRGKFKVFSTWVSLYQIKSTFTDAQWFFSIRENWAKSTYKIAQGRQLQLSRTVTVVDI